MVNATFTLWTAPDTCAKGHQINEARQLVKVPARVFVYADARRYEAQSQADFALLLEQCKPGHFLTAGVGIEVEQLQTRRLKEAFQFPDGAGLLILDGDGLDAFDGIKTMEQYVCAIRQLDPALKDVGFVTSPSASSFINWPSGDNGFRGVHAFCFVDDARQVPFILDALHRRSLAKGMARAKVTARGTVLIRSLVDLAMKTPNQPCFEGGARLLSEGIEQNRTIQIFEGGILKASSFDLGDAQMLEAAKRTEATLKRKHKTEAETKSEVWLQGRSRAMVSAGVDLDKAEKISRSMLKGDCLDLPDHWALHLDDGRVVTVAQVLADRQSFDAVTCCDPLEPETGQCKAKFYCGKDQDKPLIHSLSRGCETRYFLKGKNSTTSTFTPFTTSPKEEENHYYQGFEGDYNDNNIFTQASPASPDSSKIPKGALIYTDEHNQLHRYIASHARNRVLPFLNGKFAWCSKAFAWYRWTGTHWGIEGSSATFEKHLDGILEKSCSPLGFTPSYQTSISDLIKTGASLPLPEIESRNVLPFSNGLLDLKTKVLTPATPNNALTWCLPYDYSPLADCPTTKAWLAGLVDGDQEMVEYLLAWLAAILTGRADLQKFLYLYGIGGTGKSTFIRLSIDLVGACNTHSTTLTKLEGGRFELAAVFGTRLCSLSDAGRWGGALDNLKGLTGQDHLNLERKNQQQKAGDGFVYEGIVVFASNENLVSTDLTSSIDRRRAVVSMNRVVTQAEKDQWNAYPEGIETVLHNEIPGLVNWLLSLDRDTVKSRINNPPESASRSNHDATLAGNPVARWLVETCVPESTACTVIGQCKEIRENGSLEYEGAEEDLYPNYLAFTQADGIKYIQRNRFVETILDVARTFGAVVENGKHIRKAHDGRYAVKGLRFRRQGEAVFSWRTLKQVKSVKVGEGEKKPPSPSQNQSYHDSQASGEEGEAKLSVQIYPPIYNEYVEVEL